MIRFRENLSAKHIVGGLAFVAVFVISIVAMFHTEVTDGGTSLLVTLGQIIGLGGAFFCFFEFDLPEDDEECDEELGENCEEEVTIFSTIRLILLIVAVIVLFASLFALALIDLSEQATKILMFICIVSGAVGLVISKYESDYYCDDYDDDDNDGEYDDNNND